MKIFSLLLEAMGFPISKLESTLTDRQVTILTHVLKYLCFNQSTVTDHWAKELRTRLNESVRVYHTKVKQPKVYQWVYGELGITYAESLYVDIIEDYSSLTLNHTFEDIKPYLEDIYLQISEQLTVKCNSNKKSTFHSKDIKSILTIPELGIK